MADVYRVCRHGVMADAVLTEISIRCFDDAVDQLDRLKIGRHTTGSHDGDADFDVFIRRASRTDRTESAVHHQLVEDSTVTVAAATKVIADTNRTDHRFVAPKDFELLKVIGMGAFGKVLQVRSKFSGKIHAMKVISKRLLRRKSGYIENILVEQMIMAKVRHPYVVTMHCSFQTKEKLFLIMDFLAGGELFMRLGKEGIFLEKTAAFYLAEIILALDHLHSLGILHRDLKPENILLGADGHVCLTDFGLAKDFGHGLNDDEEEQRASTICGTQEYMAPEMIARKGYGRAADYWSLGCIAYEMLNGLPPFETKQGAKELFRKIMSEKVKMPVGCSAAACKLLKGLLNRDVQKRWGTTKNTMFEVGGVAFLKNAELFGDINWDRLEKKDIDPPTVLSVKNDEDLQHFHNDFTSMALPRSVVEMSVDSYRPHRVNSETFRGFSFVQYDYVLPERDSHEVDAFWNTLEEDGESTSDRASSKVAEEDTLVASSSAAVKKRPPRKRKKKKGIDFTAATPATSATNSPMPSAVATPVPSDNGDKEASTFCNPAQVTDSILCLKDIKVDQQITGARERISASIKHSILEDTLVSPKFAASESQSIMKLKSRNGLYLPTAGAAVPKSSYRNDDLIRTDQCLSPSMATNSSIPRPYSDWRNHSMSTTSPSSVRRQIKIVDSDTVLAWPQLTRNATESSAVFNSKPNAALRGVWASRANAGV